MPQRDATSSTGRQAAEDPRVTRSRAAIVDAATTHFLELGYLAANLDRIADDAGVSKRTIYNIYDGKEELFRAILAEAIDAAEHFSSQTVARIADADDVAAELRAAATQLARTVLGGRIVPLRRLLIGEAKRFPELAREYYERAPGRVMNALAEAFRSFDERGVLRVDDPAIAAEQFAFLVLGSSLDRALFDPHGEQSAELVEARAASGVETFLRAYG